MTIPDCIVESGLAETAVPPPPSIRQSEDESEEEVDYGENEGVNQRSTRNGRPPTYLKDYACRTLSPLY